MIDTKYHDETVYPFTNYFNLTKIIFSLDQDKLYLISGGNKECLKSFYSLLIRVYTVILCQYQL